MRGKGGGGGGGERADNFPWTKLLPWINPNYKQGHANKNKKGKWLIAKLKAWRKP